MPDDDVMRVAAETAEVWREIADAAEAMLRRFH
jgi:hypothetical protein